MMLINYNVGPKDAQIANKSLMCESVFQLTY